MAATVAQTVQGGTDVDTTAITTAAIAGGTSQAYIFEVVSHAGLTNDPLSVDGGGLTWTRDLEAAGGRGTQSLQVWTARGNVAASTFTVTATWGPVAGSVSVSYKLHRITGAAVTGPLYSGLSYRNTNGAAGAFTGGTDSTAATVTLDHAAPTDPGLGLVFLSHRIATVTTPDPDYAAVGTNPEVHVNTPAGVGSTTRLSTYSRASAPDVDVFTATLSQATDWIAAAMLIHAAPAPTATFGDVAVEVPVDLGLVTTLTGYDTGPDNLEVELGVSIGLTARLEEDTVEVPDADTDDPDPPAEAGVEPVATFARGLYADLEPVAWDDERQGWALRTFVEAIGVMFERVTGLVRDTPQAQGWERLTHVQLAGTRELPWLAQLAGVSTRSPFPAVMRAAIRDREQAERGTVQALKRAAVRSGGLAITVPDGATAEDVDRLAEPLINVVERAGGDAYALLVTTAASLTTSPTLVERALRSQKAAGLILTYLSTDAIVWDDEEGTWDAAVGVWDDQTD